MNIFLPHLVLQPVRPHRSVNVYGLTIVNVYGEGVKGYLRTFLKTWPRSKREGKPQGLSFVGL